METRSQIDLMISALVLIRRASSAIDAALGLPAADRARLESQLDAVRSDLGLVLHQVGGAIPGASALGKRPETKAVAGVVEFLARQGASQLGAVAGFADALRGGDSRALSQRIERRLAEVGVASREDLAEALGIDPDSPQLQEGIERALGSGRAEWYGPGVYGVPRGQLEEMSAGAAAAEPVGAEPAEAETGPGPEEEVPTGREHLQSAVSSLESSLVALGSALQGAESGESESERIRELRRLSDEGVISPEEYAARKAEILGGL